MPPCSTSNRRSGATSRSPPRAAPHPDMLRRAGVGALEHPRHLWGAPFDTSFIAVGVPMTLLCLYMLWQAPWWLPVLIVCILAIIAPGMPRK